jgi:hypothetical protein
MLRLGSMRSPVLVALVAACLLGAPRAFADGKFFSVATAHVPIPDQSAIIAFDGSTERLIIDTAFEGEGDDFAWVVPLPAAPKVGKASRGIMPTMRMVSRPRLISRSDTLIETILLLFGLAALGIGVLARRSLWVGLTLLALLAGGLFATLYWGFGIRRPDPRARSATLAGVGGSVILLHRQPVGAYDVATLKAESGDALLKWLRDEGFKVNDAIRPVVADYAREGWCFVAYRFAPDATQRSHRAHPLSFTFPAAKAVYPMRLTGVGNPKLNLDLYVFANREAVATGMTRKRVGFCGMEGIEGFSDDKQFDPQIFINHPDLTPLVNGAQADGRKYDSYYYTIPGGKIETKGPCLTKLSGTLDASQMRRDLVLEWREPKPYREVVVLPKVAIAWVLRAAVLTMLALALLGLSMVAIRKGPADANQQPDTPLLQRAVRLGLFAMLPLMGGFFLWLIYEKPDGISGLLDFYDDLTPTLILTVYVAIMALAIILVRAILRPGGAWYVLALLVPMALPASITLAPYPRYYAMYFVAPLMLIASATFGFVMIPAAYDTRRIRRWLAVVGAGGLLAVGVTGLAVWGYVGKGTTGDSKWRPDIVEWTMCRQVSRQKGGFSRPLAELRPAFVQAAREANVPNYITGQPIIEEDSPGNYTLEEADGDVFMRIYGITGGVERRVPRSEWAR